MCRSANSCCRWRRIPPGTEGAARHVQRRHGSTESRVFVHRTVVDDQVDRSVTASGIKPVQGVVVVAQQGGAALTVTVEPLARLPGSPLLNSSVPPLTKVPPVYEVVAVRFSRPLPVSMRVDAVGAGVAVLQGRGDGQAAGPRDIEGGGIRQCEAVLDSRAGDQRGRGRADGHGPGGDAKIEVPLRSGRTAAARPRERAAVERKLRAEVVVGITGGRVGDRALIDDQVRRTGRAARTRDVRWRRSRACRAGLP